MLLAIGSLALATQVDAQSVFKSAADLAGALVAGGASESEIVAFLDQPEATRGIGDTRAVEFRQGDNPLLILYGTQQLGLYPIPTPITASLFQQLVKNASSLNDFLLATVSASSCASNCQGDINKLIIRLQAYDLGASSPIAVSAIQLAIAERAQRLNSPVSKTRLVAQRDQVKQNLLRDLTTVIERLRNRATANRAIIALPQAKALLSQGQFQQAWAIVSPFANNTTIAAAMPELSSVSRDWLNRNADESIRSTSFSELARFVAAVETVPGELIPETELVALLDRVAEAVKRIAVSKVSPGFSADSVEGMRLLAWRSTDLLVDDQQAKLLDLFEFPSLASSTNIVNATSCPIDSGHLRELLRSKIHPVANRDEPSTLNFDIATSCEISDATGPAQSVPSSYKAGVQQLANPEYALAQAQLADARANLAKVTLDQALSPPVGGWAGAAAGLTKGLAETRVSFAQRKLMQTPPFIENPVSAPYSAVKRTVTRSGTVRFRIRLNDAGTGFADTREASLNGELSDDEFTGVMPSDERGLQNKEATLPQASALFINVMKSDAAELQRAMNELLQSALLARAQTGTDKTKRLGSLLFAYDVDPNSNLITPVAGIIKALSDTPITELLSVIPPSPPAVSKPTRAIAATATGNTRVAVAATALRALVTITSPTGSGTGFLVSKGGLILTNAHVVEKATRLTARNMAGDEFLVSVVETDTPRDLALLRVTGWNADPLRLADADSVSVGEDVLAVGNPLGLEGTVTRGIVSAKRRIDGIAVLQIDAAISPGSSGGPLLNEQGDVIGVTTWKINGQRTSAESLGFAVAASEIVKAFGQRLNLQ